MFMSYKEAQLAYYGLSRADNEFPAGQFELELLIRLANWVAPEAVGYWKDRLAKELANPEIEA